MCIDSQTIKTTEVGGDERGYDGGKKINGRNQHLLVDTMGLLIAVVITSAALRNANQLIRQHGITLFGIVVNAVQFSAGEYLSYSGNYAAYMKLSQPALPRRTPVTGLAR